MCSIIIASFPGDCATVPGSSVTLSKILVVPDVPQRHPELRVKDVL